MPLGAANGADRHLDYAGQPPLIGLRDMAGVLRQYIRPLSLWIVLCVSAAGWYLHVTPLEYSAAATVILEPRSQTGPVPGGSPGAYPPTLDSPQTESELQVIRSERILASVFDLLNLQSAPELADHGPGLKDLILATLRLTPQRNTVDAEAEARARAFQAFSDRVGVRRIGQSYVLEVSYRAASAQQAARIANAVTLEYIRSQVSLKAAAAENGTEYLQGRITALKAEQDAALDGVLKGQVPAVPFPDADVRVIGAALPPLGKSSPQNWLVLTVAITSGLLTGLLAIAIRRTLDRRLRTRQQIQYGLGADCLGVLPDANYVREIRSQRHALGRAVITKPNSQFAHALRAIRVATFMSAPAERHHAIGIVSWSRGEGRTTVASNLAHLMAASGDPVELIDADFQNPALTAALAPEARSGLSEALLDGVARPRSVPLSNSLSFTPAVGEGHSCELNLYFGSDRMQSLLAGMLTQRDVIFDLPPLGTASDAQALGPLLDGVVLVVDAARTTIEEASEAVHALRAVNARILGVILNRARFFGEYNRRPSVPARWR